MQQRYYNQEEMTQERLQKLAGFQIKILRTALTKYPKVKRVVYSTCSLLPEENEDVVRQVLETNFQFKLVPAKQFVSGAWKNFGSPDYGELGAYCLYARPEEDFTNGFFVAVFERLGEKEENKFFNHKIYSYKRTIDKKERKKQKKLERLHKGSEENGENVANGEREEASETNLTDSNSENVLDKTKQNSKNKKKKKSGQDKDLIEAEVLQEKEVSQDELQDNDQYLNKKSKKKKKQIIKDINHVEETTTETEVDLDQRTVVKKKKSKESTNVGLENLDKTEDKNEESKRKKEKKKMTESIKTCNSSIIVDCDGSNEKEALRKKAQKHRNNSCLESQDLPEDLLKTVEKNYSEDIIPKKKRKKTKHDPETVGV